MHRMVQRMCLGFHSISFPNEWGVQTVQNISEVTNSFHSISFPNEWGAKGFIL